MIERRHRVVENNAVLAAAQPDFGQERANSDRALLALAQDIGRTAALRQFQFQLVQGLASVRAALE